MNTSFIQAVKAYRQSLPPMTLVGVSKGQTLEAIQAAYQAGIVHIGENYLQEAQEKRPKLLHLPIQWHFIGTLQSKKIKIIAQTFDWVDTVSSIDQARKLNDTRSQESPALNVLIQVKLDDEPQKSGCAPDELLPLAMTILSCPRLCLRGLFAMPEPKLTKAAQYQSFLRYQLFFETIKPLSPTIDTLSMGTSHDWQAAIDAGSTMLRIGQALFGPRQGKTR